MLSKYKTRFFWLIALALLIATSACTAEEASPTPLPSATPTDPPATPITQNTPARPAECDMKAPAEETVINMIGWPFPIVEFYATELEKCNAVDNLQVNTQFMDSDMAQSEVRQALAADGPAPFDIIQADDAFLVELAAEGWLLPLDDLIETYKISYNLEDLSPGAMELAQVDGQTYGLPLAANTMHLFYRQDLLEKYGLSVPETYDDIIAACEVLAAEESLDLPFTMNLHAGWAWRIEFHNFLKSFGGDWLNEDNTPAFNGPEGLAAVEKMLAVVEACMGETGLNYSIDDTEAALENGNLAMANIWASRAANMDNPELSQFVGHIGFAPAPRANPSGSYSGPAAVDFYTIPANTQLDPALIFRVMLEATDLQSQLQGAEYGIVTRQAVVQQGVGGRYFEAALETINEGAGNYGTNPAIFLARPAIENHLPKVATGELSPQEALDAAAEEYINEAQAQGFLP